MDSAEIFFPMWVCFVCIYVCILMVCQRGNLSSVPTVLGATGRQTEGEKETDTVCVTSLFTPVCDCDKLIVLLITASIP